MASEVFLDTAYAIALSAPGDLFHQRALELADQLSASRTSLITTRAILLEIGNSLSRQRYRRAAIKLLDSLEVDPSVEIVPFSEELYSRAIQLFRERLDKEWGLTDCISFVVMQERRITGALTTDEHFLQAGFRALMREE
jgi:uncharacterized protein